MSADPVSAQVRRTDDDPLERLSAIHYRLHHISAHLATTIGQLLSQLDEIHANLETLIGSLRSAEPIKTGTACWSPDLELSPSRPGDEAFPPMTAPDRPFTPGEALAKLFMDNADRSANAANDELVTALRERARMIQTLAHPRNHPDPHIEGSPR